MNTSRKACSLTWILNHYFDKFFMALKLPGFDKYSPLIIITGSMFEASLPFLIVLMLEHHVSKIYYVSSYVLCAAVPVHCMIVCELCIIYSRQFAEWHSPYKTQLCCAIHNCSFRWSTWVLTSQWMLLLGNRVHNDETNKFWVRIAYLHIMISVLSK